MNAVALPVAGVWSRQWEEDPIGDSDGADRTTLVLWVQTPSGVYIDLRLPQDSPGWSLDAAQAAGIVPRPSAIGVTSTTASNDPVAIKNRASLIQHIEILCRQKSFAGVLDYQVGDTTDGTALRQDSILAQLATERLSSSDGGLGLCTCFWRRDLDYQPPSGGLDVGVCASEAPTDDSGAVLLRETGIDASYAEGWLRSLHTHQGPFMALELVEEWVESRISGLSGDTVSRSGYWVRAGNTFAYAIGRPTTVQTALALNCPERCASIPTQCVGKSLFEAANHLVQDESQQLDLVRCYVAVAGQVVAQGEGELWEIQFSTNPELVGCALCSSTSGDDAKEALVCSSLRQVPSNCEELGTSRLVDQCWSIEGTAAVHSGLAEVAARRRWRLLELDGCRLPLACRGLKHP
jgi:hypothetical protein